MIFHVEGTNLCIFKQIHDSNFLRLILEFLSIII